MAPLKQKRWNFFAAVALLLALVLGVTGISQLNFSTEPRTDSLQLSSAPRHQVLRADRTELDGWSSLRSSPPGQESFRLDASDADKALYRVQVAFTPPTPTTSTSAFPASRPTATSG